jgi:predicted nuclease of predicted toxin-antitoxin system
MVLLYADEDFDVPVAEELRRLGHDVVCVHEVGRKGHPDPDVLSFAISQGRAVLTNNHKDFRRLHRGNPVHCGIISCTRDSDVVALAQRIDHAVGAQAL